MVASRRVLPLDGGLLTMIEIRAAEQAIQRRLAKLSQPADHEVDPVIRELAAEHADGRVGGRLSEEQARGLELITGPERAAILIGPAGTGKGLVIDAAAHAEQMEGHQTFGVAVAGSTAQRLGRDSPALAGRTMTLDSLLARAAHGSLRSMGGASSTWMRRGWGTRVGWTG